MQTIHITANSRLSATLKQQSLQSQAQTVVQTPEIMTFSQWWDTWQESCLLRGELSFDELPKKVLNGFEAQWLWEQVLQEELEARETALSQKADKAVLSQTQTVQTDHDVQSIALLNVSSTAKLLYQAWSLSSSWFPEAWLDASFMSNESLLYKSCQARYLKKLTAHQWQDEVLAQQQRLSWLQQGKGRLPDAFCLHGFDELTPEIKLWQTAVESRGSQASEAGIETGGETPQADSKTFTNQQVYSAQDAQDEVQQVALWCVQQWQTLSQIKPEHEIKIGVVSPNLADYKVALSQSLDEQLSLQGLQPLSTARTTPPFYNLSLGEPLLTVPLVQNAWLSLQLFLRPQKPCRYAEWSQWLISPYTQGDFVQRQQADARFRRLQWSNFAWPKLLDTQAAEAMPEALLEKLRQRGTLELPAKLTLSEFTQAIWALLQSIGWPGNRTLNSDEHQQKTAFESAITNFSRLTEMVGQQSVSGWLSLLSRFLSEQLHQSQSKGLQPIQIMGMLEAGGQTFDALWVMGLTDEAWPRMPNPNPFLPMALQRDQRSPRCDAKRELDYALQVTERLADSAPAVVWSYAQHQGDAELLPSPLIPLTPLRQDEPSALQSLPLPAYSPLSYRSLAEQLFALRDAEQPIEWVLDARGPQVPAGSKAPGGTGILQAQSQCPLMAFMDFRLGAKYGLQSVEEGLQNTNQGILVHAVLELFWQETKTQNAMLLLTDAELTERLQAHITTSFEALQGTVESAYLELEKSRILELCLQWLALEKTRESFAVLDTEKRHLITLAGIEFTVIIDRVDQVAGERVIIDYKTGRASIQDLLKTPTKAPQLAVYLHAVKEDVSGIGYGLLHSDDGVKISAIAAEEGVLLDARSVQLFAKMADKEGHEFYETTWQDLLGHLRQQVSDLANDIQLGGAQMAFDKETDIQYAHCLLALRLPEMKQQQRQEALQDDDGYSDDLPSEFTLREED